MLWATGLAAALAGALPARAAARSAPAACVRSVPAAAAEAAYAGVPAPREPAAAPPQDTLPGQIASATLPGGARLALYREPALPLVSVRLAFELSQDDGPAEALARVAQRLMRDDLARANALYGARVSLDRSATHASFVVTGAADQLPELLAVLRRALTLHDWSPTEVQTARLMAVTRTRAELETPEPLLRRRMAQKLFPELPQDADSMPDEVSPAHIRRFWAHSFRADRMQAVVVGPVTLSAVSQLFGGWPRPDTAALASDSAAAMEAAVAEAHADSAAGAPDSATAAAARARADSAAAAAASADTLRDAPQVLYPWVALGWSNGAAPAALSVAARLVRERLGAGVRQPGAEVWWAGRRAALVLLGSAAAPPDSATPGTTALLLAGVTDAAAALTPADVAAARQAVAREILFACRTPDGLARYLGDLFERTGDPAAGQRFLLALDRVNAAAVEEALHVPDEPVLAEVRP